MNREEATINYRAYAYDLSQKVLKATANELRNITEWDEYKQTLAAKEALEKLEGK